MALAIPILCNVCGNSIASNANVCPHCGYTSEAAKRDSEEGVSKASLPPSPPAVSYSTASTLRDEIHDNLGCMLSAYGIPLYLCIGVIMYISSPTIRCVQQGMQPEGSFAYVVLYWPFWWFFSLFEYSSLLYPYCTPW